MMALGYTQQMVADELGCTIRAVQKWCATPGFYQRVDELAALAWQRIEPGLMSNIELALDVQRLMLLGKVDAKDGRYIEAKALIATVIRLLSVRRDTQPPAADLEFPPAIELPAGHFEEEDSVDPPTP